MLIKNLNKSLTASTLAFLLGVYSPEAAAYEVDNCCDWNPCCFDYGLNPPPTCPTSSCCNFFGEIEYLYWKPYVDNTPAAVLYQSDNLPAGRNTIEESYSSLSKCEAKDFNFDWDSGFRVAVGYGFPCDKWGISVDWTHYQTNDDKTLNGFNGINTNNNLVGKMPVPAFIEGNAANLLSQTEMGQVRSCWDFEFNQVDFEVFRNFYVGCSVALKPYAGVRLLFLKNHFDSMSNFEISNTDAQANTGFVSANVSQRLRSDFKSVGLKAGLETFWEAFCGIGIYGDISASALYACMDTDHKLSITNQVLDPTNEVTENIRGEFPHKWETLKFMADLALGIQWRHLVNCNQNMIVVKLGWEHHMLFRASEFMSVSKDPIVNIQAPGNQLFVGSASCRPNTGNVSLYGFVASIAYSF